MAIFNKYPYSNFQEMNLDWILQELKDLTDEWVNFASQFTGLTADAQTVPYGSGASVVVTGGGSVPYNFDFSIPAGKDLTITGQPQIRYGISNDPSVIPGVWQASVPTSITPGDYLWTRVVITYSDNTTSTYYTYARQGIDGAGSVSTVNNIGPDGNGNITLPIPDPSDNIPLVDVIGGSEGVSNDFSRADHRHPTDSSKLDVATGSVGEKNAYIIDGINIQTTMGISSSATANNIASYDANGRLNTADPAASSNAVNLDYADSNYLGITTAATTYVAKTDKATSSSLGIVQPDNATIVVDADGILRAAASLNFTEVWSNPDRSIAFSGQTITFDTTDTDALAFVVSFRATTGGASNGPSIFVPLVNRQFYCNTVTSNYLVGRGVTINTGKDSATFTAAAKWTSYGASAVTNDQTIMIPDKIYSIK